uniref:ZP domain-containing protein n=1 Tax=Neogobius melanostomus TaxID=47308 RepID=A0A8C6UJZ7_9GOBI
MQKVFNADDLCSPADDSLVTLTRSLASQCGFSSSTDASGTLRIYASLLNCFSENQDDQRFSLELVLRISPDEVYTVTETCEYADWAPREVLCQKDYMEVRPWMGLGPKSADPRRAAQVRAGFCVSAYSSLIIFITPEFSQIRFFPVQVAEVPMTVLRTSILFGRKWLSSQIHAAAVCPLLAAGISFTDTSIRWFLPKRITPLLSSGQLTLLDVGLGVDGRKLDAAELEVLRYSLTVDDTYIVVVIPIGARGGFYKSVVQDGRYMTTYRVEPFLEMLWNEDSSNEDTRYRVLFPISTPHIYRPPQVTQNTEPIEDVFKVKIGPFAPDVVLLNISCASETLTVRKALSRGFRVREGVDPESKMKSFTIFVPRTDPAVQQTKDQGHTVFAAQLIFGFMVLPELQPFAISAALEARLPHTETPSVTGECDVHHFHVLVHSGTQDFQTLVGRSPLTLTLAQQYGFEDNGTHFTFSVPILAPDVIYETIEPSVVRARLDVILVSPEDNKHITDFSLSCSFFSTLVECFPNGTITVLALKLEAVPGLDPSQLTLADSRCGPVFSTEQYAFFSFVASSCGTSRKFVGNTMVYENDVALPDEHLAQRLAENKEPEYQLKVKCLYDTNTTRRFSYHLRPSRNQPAAGTSMGQLQVQLRMAHDGLFGAFYTDGDFPLTVSQHEALWFEVELKPALGGKISLELEKCWATEDQEKNSTPRWSFINNGCVVQDCPLQVHMIPVRQDIRVHHPSQLKRFTLRLGNFIQQQGSLQLFIHCDVIICDPRNPMSGVCAGQCSEQPQGPRLAPEEHVSTGPIFVI